MQADLQDPSVFFISPLNKHFQSLPTAPNFQYLYFTPLTHPYGREGTVVPEIMDPILIWHSHRMAIGKATSPPWASVSPWRDGSFPKSLSYRHTVLFYLYHHPTVATISLIYQGWSPVSRKTYVVLHWKELLKLPQYKMSIFPLVLFNIYNTMGQTSSLSEGTEKQQPLERELVTVWMELMGEPVAFIKPWLPAWQRRYYRDFSTAVIPSLFESRFLYPSSGRSTLCHFFPEENMCYTNKI